jgi:hypothetical protein
MWHIILPFIFRICSILLASTIISKCSCTLLCLWLFKRYKTRTDTNLAPVNEHLSESWQRKLLEKQQRCKYMKHIYMVQKWKTFAQQLITEIYSWFNSVKCYVQIGVQIMTHVCNLEDRNFRELFSMKFGLQKLWTLLTSSWSQKKAEVSMSKKNTIDSTQGRTWNCTLGMLMRIQTDAIQLKALYTWRCSECEICAILRETRYLKDIMINIGRNVL